jgi:5-methylcytosine-specific restriction protein A
MNGESNIIENYGILANISWNSKKWAAKASSLDIKNSNHGYVKENGRMHEDLTFGHETYPLEDDGYYLGYSPMLRKLTEKKYKNNQIVFLWSTNYLETDAEKKKKIVGIYGLPAIGEFFRTVEKHELYKSYNSEPCNLKTHIDNIIYFNNPIPITDIIVQNKKFLPYNIKQKRNGEIGKQSSNYLNSDNVYNLINEALRLNPKNLKLKAFAVKLPGLEFLDLELQKKEFEDESFSLFIGDMEAEDIEDIEALEEKMRDQTPERKQRISSFIERGAISNKVKEMTGYKCMICEELGQNPFSFLKKGGIPYIETHHVEPVNTLKEGVLGLPNLVTVCANHHRQLHYGDSKVLENKAVYFKFKIDGKEIIINKIKINR